MQMILLLRLCNEYDEYVTEDPWFDAGTLTAGAPSGVTIQWNEGSINKSFNAPIVNVPFSKPAGDFPGPIPELTGAGLSVTYASNF